MRAAGAQNTIRVPQPTQSRGGVGAKQHRGGFGRSYHPEAARFARIAKGSEVEVLNHFIDAHDKGFLSDEESARHEHAVKKALKAVNGWIRYLEDTPDFGKH